MREALPKLIGPADSYQARVSGSNIGADHLASVHISGMRVALARVPVLNLVELNLRDVAFDRQQKRLTSVGEAHGQVKLVAGDLAEYLRLSGWLDRATVRFEPPNRIVATGIPSVAGIPVMSRGESEFQGRLFAQGSQVLLTVDYLRLGSVEATPVVCLVLRAALNPLFDISGYPLPTRIDSVQVRDGALLILASGSAVP